MNEKRGQLTIFVIVAVVVVLFLLVFFLINKDSNNLNGSGDELDQELLTIKENLLDCFNNVYLNSLIMAGFQGGYYEVEDGYYNGFVVLPYYYNKGNSNFVSEEELELEIEKYVSGGVRQCVNFSKEKVVIESAGLEVNENYKVEDDYYDYLFTSKVNDVSVDVYYGGVSFICDLDLTVIKNDGKKAIINFKEDEKVINSNLYSMREISEYVSESLKQDNEELCLTCLKSMAKEKNLKVDLINYYEENDQLIVISNDLDSVPFVYQFLNKYLGAVNENEVFER